MGTFVYGETAAVALARARHERPGNSYVEGRSCWRLHDAPKNWISSYCRTRDNGKDAIFQAATRYGCVAEQVGSNMMIYQQSTWNRAIKKFAPREVEPGEQWACYIIDPSPDIVRVAMRMSKRNAGIVMALGETIAAVAFRKPPNDKALRDKALPSAGRRVRYAPTHILDCTDARTGLREDHHQQVMAEVNAEQRDAEIARARLAQRYAFRATVGLADIRQVESVVSKMPRSHGWSGRDLFLSERAAATLAKTIRVVRHKECAAA